MPMVSVPDVEVTSTQTNEWWEVEREDVSVDILRVKNGVSIEQVR